MFYVIWKLKCHRNQDSSSNAVHRRQKNTCSISDVTHVSLTAPLHDLSQQQNHIKVIATG
jgi:hypothetical protein